jgi:ERF superfamily
MKTSETISAIATAFATAQAELKNAPFDRENPHYKSRYATLASVRDTVAPVLSKQGLAVIQTTDIVDGTWCVLTRLMHKSGEWIESVYPFNLDKPQAMGSALTYARRYALSSICGIASEEDDDGNEGNKGDAPKAMPSANGTQGASKSATRGEYDTFIKAIRNATGLAALDRWENENLGAIDKLSPDWVDELRVEFGDKKSELSKAGAM